MTSHSIVLCTVLGGLVLGLGSTAGAQPVAFPGAQGFGRYATGGRGGSVYYVTNLNDSGPGSFREAVSQPNRTVVFSVSGVIDYQPPRYNIKNNVTIAGQTAPGDGVVLYGDGIGYTDANNSITRFIRFRMGHDAVGEDTVGVARGHDMIFDHISATWSLDEVFSISGSPAPTNITIQSSIIGQGLEDHSAGGLIQTDGGVSILRSLYIDNGTRNPKVKGVNEYVNNVVYNWTVAAYIMGGDSAGDSFANVIGNYFINGPGSGGGCFSGGNANFHMYATNNWQDNNRNGVLDGFLLSQGDYDDNTWETTPFAYPIALSNALPALTALKLAISDVGPSWRRDAVDRRLIQELTSWGVLGETITTEFDPPMNGPGPFKGGPAPLDTDWDGLPDYWEAGLGMATNAPNNNDASAGGYTKLEDYLNWLAAPHGVALTNTVVLIDLRQFTLGFTNASPVYGMMSVSNGSVTLTNNHYARFVPNAGFIGQAGFDFSVADAQGSAWSGTFGLFFTPQPPAYGRLWRGDGVANHWNVMGDANWFDEQALLYPFQNGTSVEFDDTGSSAPAVSLVGSVQPAAVWVNSTNDYTFTGPGILTGAMFLNKSGSGTLTFANTNNYSGATVVSNGTLLVNGVHAASLVVVHSGATLGGAGWLLLKPTLNPGAVLAPGAPYGLAGTLSFPNGLSLPGGVTCQLDLSDDPSGISKPNDKITVLGNLNLSGVNTLQVNLLDGPLSNGVYTLLTYTGALGGNLGNLNLVGANGVLTNWPGAIGIHVDNTRPPADLVWAGNGVNNTWDDGATPTWLNGVLPDWFYFGDTVRFDDSGSASPAVNLVGTLSPAALTIDATQDYTFSGSGKISGTGGLTKTNSGTLTIQALNDYTGVTSLEGGVISISQTANAGLASPLGAAGADPANLVFDGGTLRYTGGTAGMDRGFQLDGAGAVEVTGAGTTLSLSGSLAGSGTLTKRGAGVLSFDSINSHSGDTVVEAGTVRLNVNSTSSELGTGMLTLNGGAGGATLQFGVNGKALNNTLNVIGPDNFTLNNVNNTINDLIGNGMLTLNTGTTFTFAGNMSGFSGILKVGTITNPRFNPSTGSASATFDLGNTSAKLNNRNGNITINLGALIGGPNTILEGASSANNPTTYVIGGKNLDTTFAGKIQEVVPARSVAITKVGTGLLTLTHANTHNGATTVNGGALLVCNTSGTGTGTNSVTVNSGGVLGGTGSILGPVAVNAGGALAPGSNTVGTLTLQGSLALNSAALLNFELGATNASDKVGVNGALTLGGTLNVTAQSGFGPGTYVLMTYPGSYTGSLPTLGSKPSGYSCTVSASSGQVRLTVVAQTPPTISSVQQIGGDLILSGTGPTNEAYLLLSATNVTLPMILWTPVATNTFDAAGQFMLNQPINPLTPESYYRLQLP